MPAITPILERTIVALRVGGASIPDIAKSVGLSVGTVHKYISKVENAAVITSLRDAVRLELTQRLAGDAHVEGIAVAVLERVREAALNGTTREIDEAARA